MTDSSPLTQWAGASLAGDTPLGQEYHAWQARLEAQPAVLQRFLESQASVLAETLTQRDRPAQVRFTLPDRAVVEPGGQPQPVPAEFRQQLAGGLMDRLSGANVNAAVRGRLAELEQSPNRAVSVSAGLLRHATAMYMVRGLLPAGRSVTYLTAEGETIPSLPTEAPQTGSAITEATDAIAEEGAASSEAGRGELLVPYVPDARRFYLPQWVAFGDGDRLLVNSLAEAEAYVAAMQRFLAVLHAAVALAPYMTADEAYQQRRYGMLGQLVNQGRALARYQTRDIIATIQRRAAAQDLNRGLSLNLPYFDDQTLRLETHGLEIIPAGRIMFVPAFVVRAALAEQAKVAQDTRLSPATRQHLLSELKLLEDAFAAR